MWASADRVNNLLPTAQKLSNILEVLFTGKKQDASYIQVWGCVAFLHVPKEWGKSKIDPDGIE